MKLPRAARKVYQTVAAPAARPSRIGLVRSLLLVPRIFDMVSLALQLRDYQRLRAITNRYAAEDPYLRQVQDYNMEVTLRKFITTTRRAEPLYHVATLAADDLPRADLLIIGPRNIHELFIAWLSGFRWRHIRGIDLFSTHPKIAVMSMETMTFDDASFDVVVMSNTLAYASDTFKCLSETARVLRPGGRLVFGATYDPGDATWRGSTHSGQQILDMLRDLDFRLYYYRPTDKVNSLGRLQTSHVFGCVKPRPEESAFDRIRW